MFKYLLVESSFSNLLKSHNFDVLWFNTTTGDQFKAGQGRSQLLMTGAGLRSCYRQYITGLTGQLVTTDREVIWRKLPIFALLITRVKIDGHLAAKTSISGISDG